MRTPRLVLTLSGAIGFFILAGTQLIAVAHGQSGRTPSHHRAFLHQVNIVGPRDDRDEISKKAQELRDLGFRQEDFDQAMSCNVLFYCPNNSPDTRAWGSGFDAGVRGQALTALHILHNEIKSDLNGKDRIFFPPRRSFAGCFVKNYIHPDDRIPFAVTVRESTEKIGRIDPQANDRANNWAIVELTRPLQGCRPYSLSVAPARIKIGEKLINISFPQEGMSKKATGREPVVQICQVREVYHVKGGPTPIGIDCDGGGGGSGGLLLGWLSEPDNPNGRGGHFQPRGMVIATAVSNSSNNYLPFGFTADPNHSSGTYALAIDHDFLMRALHLPPLKKEAPAKALMEKIRFRPFGYGPINSMRR